MILDWHVEALEEAENATQWYAMRSHAAGVRFDDELDRLLIAIVKRPLVFAPFGVRTRRAVFDRFPYSIVYQFLPSDRVRIIAVAHASRMPFYWKSRLTKDRS